MASHEGIVYELSSTHTHLPSDQWQTLYRIDCKGKPTFHPGQEVAIVDLVKLRELTQKLEQLYNDSLSAHIDYEAYSEHMRRDD